MTINTGNIEAYLLDYLEGNLDALLTAELMAFLSENPEYEKWIPEYDGHICLETGPVFEDKLALRKDFKDVPRITEHNFDEFCIASTEGLLSERDHARLDEYIVLNPEKKPDFDLYRKLILQPDNLLVYPEKKNLKKREPVVVPLRYIYYAVGVAASIALLLMLVSRKPAEPVLSGITPAKSTIGQEPANRPVPVTIPPEAPKVTAPVPAGNPVATKPVNHEDALIPAETESDLTPLTSIEPIRIARILPESKDPEIHRTIRYTGTPATNPETMELGSVPEPTPASVLGSLVRKLNLWKAAEKAVTGFNYLTESRLSLVRTTDENGKFSSLTLKSEDYIISDGNVK